MAGLDEQSSGLHGYAVSVDADGSPLDTRGDARRAGSIDAMAMIAPPDAATTEAASSARIRTIANLLLLAGTATASLEASARPDRDRGQAAMVSVALEEALAELRLLAIELSPIDVT